MKVVSKDNVNYSLFSPWLVSGIWNLKVREKQPQKATSAQLPYLPTHAISHLETVPSNA